MCRHRAKSPINRAPMAAIIALVCGALAWTSSSALGVNADENIESDELQALTEWLSQAELTDLLAVVLSEHLAKSPTTAPLIEARLVDAYVRLLASASDEDRVLDLRSRITKFLSPARGAYEAVLRLALARSEYRIALHDIEKLGRGVVDPALASRAEAALARTIEPLSKLETLLAECIDNQQRRAGGAEEADRVASLLAADECMQQRLQVQFVRAWCHYWALWLGRTTPPPTWQREGEQLIQEWSALLETGKPFPEPSDTSVDLRGEEYYAQSILGMALTKNLMAGPATAQPWFELLEDSGVWSGLRNITPWRLQAAIDAGAYDAASRLLDSDSSDLTCAQIVGAALRGCDQSKSSAPALVLAEHALVFAANAGELSAVRTLATRVPQLAQGDGFAPALARGVEAYELGRASADNSRKRAQFERAESELVRAVAQAPPDAQTRSAVEELLAWARMGCGHLCDASDAFVRAAEQIGGARAEQLLWMATQSAKSGACADQQGVIGARGYALAREYLRAFPDGDHATDAAAALASDPQAHRDDLLVDALLQRAIQPLASRAIREAASSLIYQRFRAAHAADRGYEARRLLTIGRSDANDWPSDSIDIVVRQQLEAALDPAVEQAEIAAALLAAVQSRYSPGTEPLELRAEFAVRRLALALVRDDPAGAIAAIEIARETSDVTWRPIAESLFVRGIERMIVRGKVQPEILVEGMLALVSARRSLFDAARRSGDSRKADAAHLTLGIDLLRAAKALRMSGDPSTAAARDGRASDLARDALAIAREVLNHRLDDAQAFALMADAAMACGEFDAAIEALSRLVGGLPAQSDAWFERKADFCEMLARSDPAQAKQVLAQHAVLIPQWGPGTAGERLRALANQLGVADSTSTRGTP